MRIVQATVELPLPSRGSGGATRQFALVSRLARLGHDVTVIAPVVPGDETAARAVAALAEAGVRFVAVSRPQPRRREVLRALARRPALAPALLRDPWFPWQFSVFFEWVRPRLEALIAETRPDVVVFEHDDIAGWGTGLPALGAPAVLEAHNATWRVFQRRGTMTGGFAGAVLRAEAVRHRCYTRRHLGSYAAVIAVSDDDARELTALGARRVFVIPNGADTHQLPAQAESAGPPTLLFTGSTDHPPNPEGIVWFADEIWPRIQADVPGARLVVVGRGPREPVRALEGRRGIELAGEVESVLPALRDATLVIAPLRSGGGSRLKILEAMSACRAVVATTIGAEGIAVTPGRDVLIADDPVSFAAACVDLLRDPERRQAMAAAGNELVRARYDWDALGARLAETLGAISGARL